MSSATPATASAFVRVGVALPVPHGAQSRAHRGTAADGGSDALLALPSSPARGLPRRSAKCNCATAQSEPISGTGIAVRWNASAFLPIGAPSAPAAWWVKARVGLRGGGPERGACPGALVIVRTVGASASDRMLGFLVQHPLQGHVVSLPIDGGGSIACRTDFVSPPSRSRYPIARSRDPSPPAGSRRCSSR
jgi:hypothetical protein